jgi:hypothetical protein
MRMPQITRATVDRFGPSTREREVVSSVVASIGSSPPVAAITATCSRANCTANSGYRLYSRSERNKMRALFDHLVGPREEAILSQSISMWRK